VVVGIEDRIIQTAFHELILLFQCRSVGKQLPQPDVPA